MSTALAFGSAVQLRCRRWPVQLDREFHHVDFSQPHRSAVERNQPLVEEGAEMFDSTRSDKIFQVINYAFLGFILLIVLYPLVFVLSASLSSPELLLKGKSGCCQRAEF